jgi:hypothetical protein
LVGAARAALSDRKLDGIHLKPLGLAYARRNGLPVTRRERPAIAWYGDMDLAPHLAAFVREGPLDVEVTWGEPILFDAATDRKRATAEAERRCGAPSRDRPAPPRRGRRNPPRRDCLFSRGEKRLNDGLRPPPGSFVKTVYVKSYGCQMNQYDAQRMADVLAPEGFAETQRAEDADLVILNTCHIREKAVEKVYSELGRVRETKRARAEAGRATTVVVAGCVAQAEGSEILRRAPVVDVVVGPQSYHRLPALIAQARPGRAALDTEFPVEPKFGHLPAPSRKTTAERGISGLPDHPGGLRQVLHLLRRPLHAGRRGFPPGGGDSRGGAAACEAGVREITLIGQNVNAYRGEGSDGAPWGLARLLEAAAAIPGIVRLALYDEPPARHEPRSRRRPTAICRP